MPAARLSEPEIAGSDPPAEQICFRHDIAEVLLK